MKAIVTSMDPKAAEPGFHARAPKSATGAVFGPFFAMKDLLTPEAADVAGPVSVEVPTGPPVAPEVPSSRSWLSRIEPGRRAAVAGDALGAPPPDGIVAEPGAAEAGALAVVLGGAQTEFEAGEGAHLPFPVSDGIVAEPSATEAGALAVVLGGAQTEHEAGEGAHLPLPPPDGADLKPVSYVVFSHAPEALSAEDQDAIGPAVLPAPSDDPGQGGAIPAGAVPADASTAGGEATETSAPSAAGPISRGAGRLADTIPSQPDRAAAAPAAAARLGVPEPRQEPLVFVPDQAQPQAALGAVALQDFGPQDAGPMSGDGRDRRGHVAPRALPDAGAPLALETHGLEGARVAVVPGRLPQMGETPGAAPTSEAETVLPLDPPEGVPPRAEPALKAMDRALAPGETPQRAALTEPVTPPRETSPEGHHKTSGAVAEGQSTPPIAAREAQAKPPVIVPVPAGLESLAAALLPKAQPVARMAMPGGGDRFLTPGPTGPRSASWDPKLAPVTGQRTRIAASDARAAEQTANALAAETALRAQTPLGEQAQAAAERSETPGVTSAAARSSGLAPPPVPVAFAAATLNLRQADWGKQLVGQIERMIKDGSQRMELSLRPKNLGEIRVMLDLRGDQTHVHIVTETAAAARLLSGAEERLAQVLDQSGYRLSGFSAQEQGAGAQGGQQGQPSARRHRPAGDAAGRQEPSESVALGPYSGDRAQSAGINMLA